MQDSPIESGLGEVEVREMLPRRSRLKRTACVFALAMLAMLASASVAGAAPTVVSLTFDDGYADQYVARSLLGSHGMRGTFYTNSNNVGKAGFLTWSQLNDLYIDGNEIGGHTLDHVDLTTVSTAEAQRQVCDDRANLLAHGFSPTDFAYPYGARNSTVIQIVKDCGYSSGRRAWGLRSPGSPTYYPYAETIPPQDIYQIRTPDGPQSTTSLSTIQSYVTQAEQNGGGWVPLLFHHICDGCATYSTSQATLAAFLDWLQPRAASGTVVKTVQQVVSPGSTPPTSDSTPPTSSIACNGSGCSSGWYRSPVSVSLSATDDRSGVAAIRYTTDGSEPTTTSTLYTASFGVSQTATVKFRAWDNAGNVETTKSQPIKLDSITPSVSITSPADGATVTGRVTIMATAGDAGSGVAAVRFYVDGSLIGTSTNAPYRLNWNSRKASKGPHRLTAVAEDVAGNVQTSQPVAVTVN